MAFCHVKKKLIGRGLRQSPQVLSWVGFTRVDRQKLWDWKSSLSSSSRHFGKFFAALIVSDFAWRVVAAPETLDPELRRDKSNISSRAVDSH